MMVDIFPFFNELDILEIRLRELDGIVDRFVAIQCEETHAGLTKPIYLDPSDPRWAPWAGRLTTAIIPPTRNAKNRWDRERAPRDATVSLLADLADDDVVLMSDVDEIPETKTVAAHIGSLTSDVWVGFALMCCAYYLNLRTPGRHLCVALARMDTVRRIGGQGFRDQRLTPPIGPIPAGWHFSYMGGISAIIQKLAAYAHEEYDTETLRNPALWQAEIEARHVPFRIKWRHLHQLPLDRLPIEIARHPNRYAHLLAPRRTNVSQHA